MLREDTSSKKALPNDARMKETVERFAVVIWPLVVKEEGFMLVDDYCRYTTLKALNVSRSTRM